MSGHSKWATTHRQKEINDKQRSGIISKKLKDIAVAVKTGGSTDPANNHLLHLAIQNAKGANVPKDKIENAINRANTDTSHYSNITYEATWGKVQLVIMCMTDNTNRTVSEVRKTLRDYEAKLVESGSITYNFNLKSSFIIKKHSFTDFDEFLFHVPSYDIENGYEYDEDNYCIIGKKEAFGSLQQLFEEEKLEITDSGLFFIPIDTVKIDEEMLTTVENLIQELEDLEDVRYVATNIE